ncbi:hypothetical protein ACIA5D_25260 [Actinoplanes sp. NPDC051513]|uniref:hypothetical protein n=1 Tax=Actinoplanes sp. NPDC051513 TaxID=3363908 RepID=UPI00379B1F3E
MPLLPEGWMVGDNSEKDVGGDAGAGLRTGWVALGREWPAGLQYRPTVTGTTGMITLRQVLSAT